MQHSQRNFAIGRDFRGAVLWLVSYNLDTLAFDWSADSARAQRFDALAPALQVAGHAAREYGAQCHVRDAKACAIVPAEVELAEPVTVAKASEFRRVTTAAVNDRVPRCVHSSGCDMPAEPGDVFCADCRSARA